MPAVVWAGALAVALALGIAVVVLANPRQGVSRDRLVVGGAPVAARRTTTAGETVALAQRVLHRVDPGNRLPAALELAGLQIKAPDLLVVGAVASVTGALLGAVVGGALLSGLLLVAAPLAIWAFVRVRTDRRRRAFAEQLVDALQLMASSMRAGHSLLRAVDAVSRDTQAPTSEEFARVVNEARVGRDLGAALDEVADRTGSEDFRWVVQAIEVHREVGGNLAEVLDRVGETLRDRAQLFRQARSLSAEGRTSGIVLLVMPVVVTGVVAVTAPAYLAPLYSTGLGIVMSGVALTLMVVGAVWLRSIVKVRF
ncbi:type II secretion system F family protein [Klenkia sp. PcliD-1-E]|uniref:type II secretion system F family protein n=1 Tax=Klenkia sp. PcliD-1-E TaxID=2954492 RepID=UPI002098207A|nr:type II secretion system F family protein [Klenkia sp. PcliD-1-E]MCO7219865.1 type II secretion system F family protein [Klenkia sp. PcliD-1-E]